MLVGISCVSRSLHRHIRQLVEKYTRSCGHLCNWKLRMVMKVSLCSDVVRGAYIYIYMYIYTYHQLGKGGKQRFFCNNRVFVYTTHEFPGLENPIKKPGFPQGALYQPGVTNVKSHFGFPYPLKRTIMNQKCGIQRLELYQEEFILCYFDDFLWMYQQPKYHPCLPIIPKVIAVGHCWSYHLTASHPLAIALFSLGASQSSEPWTQIHPTWGLVGQLQSGIENQRGLLWIGFSFSKRWFLKKKNQQRWLRLIPAPKPWEFTCILLWHASVSKPAQNILNASMHFMVLNFGSRFFLQPQLQPK